MFRLVPPHTEKNPYGITTYIKHNMVLDQMGKQVMPIWCPASYGEDCPLCGFVSMVTGDEKYKQGLPSDAYEIIEGWAPDVYRLVPTVWKLTMEKANEDAYPEWFYNEEGELPVLLNLKKGKKSLDGIYDDIIDLLHDNAELPDLDDGTWIKLVKRGENFSSYKLKDTGESAKLSNAEEVIKSYPSLSSYGKSYKKDFGSIVAAIESSWAYGEFVKAFDEVDFS